MKRSGRPRSKPAWKGGWEEGGGPAGIEPGVNACLHPLYEIEHGVTAVTFDPEARNKKAPVTDAFALMGGAFRHLATPEYGALAAEIQAEVDRRWAQLKVMSGN